MHRKTLAEIVLISLESGSHLEGWRCSFHRRSLFRPVFEGDGLEYRHRHSHSTLRLRSSFVTTPASALRMFSSRSSSTSFAYARATRPSPILSPGAQNSLRSYELSKITLVGQMMYSYLDEENSQGPDPRLIFSWRPIIWALLVSMPARSIPLS
ncbi:hypothetical protein BDR06DRAFT_40158 [Suillus hirtellus]|nr:hypothetical protein BDR06DRAFT_40158 [Suillus hirtellus]